VLGLLDIVVAGLKQLEDDVLDILAHITGLGQGGGVGHGEGHVKRLGQRLGQQRLARPRGADQQDVRLRQLDIATLAAVLQPLVVVVHRHRQHALGPVLTDHIIVQRLEDVARGWHAAVLLAGDACLGLFADDVVAQLNAFVADKDRRPSDQLANLMLALAAEAAIEGALGIGSAQFRHRLSCFARGTRLTAPDP
jgi:hypothetical protein